MAKKTICYRGSLKSCNYHCSYCPFSKHRALTRELMRDQEQWSMFCRSLKTRAAALDAGAVLVTPYGEALIHPWYWEGLGSLSAINSLDAVGCQTNLSFCAADSLRLFDLAGGHRKKLRLWATFHPEMISVSRFAKQVHLLCQEGILLSVGAVGVPENLPLLKELRKALPSEVYLWVNRMDGLRRAYTPEEKKAFTELDPYFPQELMRRKADMEQCQDRLFIEGSGTLRACCLSQTGQEDWYALPALKTPLKCGRSACTCYLAYAGRRDYEYGSVFGPYPLFRIPQGSEIFHRHLSP